MLVAGCTTYEESAPLPTIFLVVALPIVAIYAVMSHSVRACCCIMTFTSMTVWLMNRLPSSPGGTVAELVRALAWTGDRPGPAGFQSHCGKFRFGTLAIPLTPLCQCLLEETLKAVGPFYLVSMPWK